MVLWWAAFFMLGLISPPGTPFACAASYVLAILSIIILSRSTRHPVSRPVPGEAPFGRAVAYWFAVAGAAIILWEGAGIEKRAFVSSATSPTGPGYSSNTTYTVTPRRRPVALPREERLALLLPGIARLREYLIASLDDGRLTERAGGIVGALVLDYRRDLGFDLSETYSYLGITHFLALSGMHLGVIAVPLSKLLSLVLRSRRRRDPLLFVLLCLYAAVAAFPASLSRALALSAAVIGYRLLGLHSGLLTALVGGCFALVAMEPHVVFDAGFQLSFAAVCGIALIGIPLSSMVGAIAPKGTRGTILKVLLFPGLITCSVQFLTLPLTIALFKRASLISPLVNVIVSLPFTGLLYLGVIYVFVPVGPIRALLSVPINLICGFLDVVPTGFARGRHPALYYGDFNFGLYLAGTGLVAYWLRRRIRRRLPFLLAGALLIASSFVVRSGRQVAGEVFPVGGDLRNADGCLTSGQGASFVPWKGGILIVNERFSVRDSYRLTRQLWGKGVREIELCIIKSSRLKSGDGLFYLVRRVAVRELLCGPSVVLAHTGFAERLEHSGTRVHRVARGDRVLTGSFVVDVTDPLWPLPRTASVPADSLRLRCRIVERARLTSPSAANTMLTVR